MQASNSVNSVRVRRIVIIAIVALLLLVAALQAWSFGGGRAADPAARAKGPGAAFNTVPKPDGPGIYSGRTRGGNGISRLLATVTVPKPDGPGIYNGRTTGGRIAWISG